MTRKQKKMLLRIFLSAGLMVLLSFLPAEGLLRFSLYLIPYLIIGYDILLDALKGLWSRQLLDENFLMAVATVGALILGLTQTGDYVEAVAVMLFYQIGELFQSYAVGKSRKSITALMDIRPDYANIETPQGLKQIDPEELEPGSIIVVQPGERVPIDGEVIEGHSALNTAALTGESLPRDAAVGDMVYSGTINLDGVLKLRTTCLFEESTASKILDLVENASSRKSRSEHFISKFARVYTPVVCLCALALALLPPLVQGLLLNMAFGWAQWLYRALTFLVISCPCALVISIPLSFFAGLGCASKAGILIKGSNYLEALSKTQTMVFDKTGTLTQGVFAVEKLCPQSVSGEKLLEAAALAECASSHPIGKSLRDAYGKHIDRSRVTDIRECSGKGICAMVDGQQVLVGNRGLMEEFSIAYTPNTSPCTVVYTAINGRFAGSIEIADKLKANAENSITALRSIGVKHCVLLSGDRAAAVQRTAEALGISIFHGELLPGDKVLKVEALLQEKSKGKTLAFVGDGINDAPVLSRADIGIAMGAMGSDAAIEAADVVLMDDDPAKLPHAIAIARKCMRIVYQNTVFAIGIKLLCLLLGAMGFANMALAIFADVGVMVLAVLNAIRALYIRKPL